MMRRLSTIRHRGSKRVVIMDGATGSQLFRAGVPRGTTWSAPALADAQHHSKVVQVHSAYLRAGADIITTSNYAVQPSYYRKAFGTTWRELMASHTAASL